MSEINEPKDVTVTAASDVEPPDASLDIARFAKRHDAKREQDEMKKVTRRPLILAVLAVVCSLASFGLKITGTPPLYFSFPDISKTISRLTSEGDLFSLATLLEYATPILLAVLLALQGKIRRWLVMVPLVMPLVVFFIKLVWTASITGEFSMFIFYVLFKGSLLELLIFAGTIIAAILCALVKNPKPYALIGFGIILTICTFSLFTAQPPFGSTGDYSFDKSFYIDDFLSYAFMLASVAYFVVICDEHELTPLFEMKRSADGRGNREAKSVVPNPTENDDEQAGSPDVVDADTVDFSSTGLSSSSDPYEHLRKIKALQDEGVITADEYELKKKELLEKIGS